MGAFKQYISEAKGQLDISIMNASKYLINVERKEEFLTSDVTVEHKTDGIKLTLVKQDNTGVAEKDWIVAYKGNIIYFNEFDFTNNTEIKMNSIGNSQFAIVWDHLFKLRKTNIPVGTELFIEFLMNKPTLSSNYNIQHKMVLIGYSTSSWTTRQGKLTTKPVGFFTEKRNEYASELKIDIPALLFQGVLGNKVSFAKGIKDKDLKNLYRNTDINWDSTEDIIEKVSQLFLDVESKYGGKEEGVVIKYKDKILKFQQPYQTDQIARDSIKSQFRGSKEYEDEYYSKVHTVVDNLIKDIKEIELQDALTILSKKLRSFTPDFEHIKKSKFQIIDDIQLTARMMLSKKMPGNNGALVVGKFRVLTNAHYDMIKEALAKYDTVTVCIVSSKETKGTKALRNNIMSECFPEVEIINTSSGNLYTIMNKSKYNINTVIAGSDRVDRYRKMLENNRGTDVYEINRTDEDISASKIIENINDETFFTENTPDCLLEHYSEYTSIYTK